jgi:hypothetical protein
MWTRRTTAVSLLLSLFFLFSLSACGGRQSAVVNETGVLVDLDTPSLQVGETELLVRLTDSNGRPAAGAAVEVRGDMSHAGMVPVVRAGETDADGLFATPFEWTMGGDWFVTVTFTLPDGRSGAERFNYTVVSR